MYSRTGICLATLLTRLPGGGLGQSSSMMHRYETVLDCIMLGAPTATMTHQEKSLTDTVSTEVSAQHPKEKLVFMVLDLVSFKSTFYGHITVAQFTNLLKLYMSNLIWLLFAFSFLRDANGSKTSTGS